MSSCIKLGTHVHGPESVSCVESAKPGLGFLDYRSQILETTILAKIMGLCPEW